MTQEDSAPDKDDMNVLIVSGFLGAGKTTFIKELIRRSKLAPVVLENEYGASELDKKDISKTGDLEILEFMEGCVCCTKKDSFMNTVLAISAGLDPEYLVIEPTGVGKLGNIIKNIEAVSYDRIKLLPPVVIIAPNGYDANMNEFPEIYRNQIENAGVVVLSKTDVTDSSLTESVTAKIREMNNSADIIEDHYTGRPDEWFRSLLTSDGDRTYSVTTEEADADLDEITVRGGSFSAPSRISFFLENMLRGEFGAVVRAKGIVTCGREKLRFDLADGMYAVIKEDDDKALRQSVFIGTGLMNDKIMEAMNVEKPDESVRSAFLNNNRGR